MSFIHRFGASLKRHVHYHCCVIDGVFEPVEEAGDIPQSVCFRLAAELTPQALAAIAEQVRVRVLRWFARSGLIEPDDVREMRGPRSPPSPTEASRWMPQCASVPTIAPGPFLNRARLLRCCARPTFALERLELINEQQVIYRLPRTQRDGTTALTSSLTSVLPGSRRLSAVGDGAAALVYRRHAAPKIRALATRNGRAGTARHVRQPLRGVLMAHPVRASLLSRANLDAQGGLDFLSVGVRHV